MPFKKKTENVNVEGVNPLILQYLQSLPKELQNQIVVTAGKEPTGHAKNSRHKTGNAIDLRFSKELYDYIANDSNREKSGLTLLDPNHGTAPHIHLSAGNGSENKLDIKPNEVAKVPESLPTSTPPMVEDTSSSSGKWLPSEGWLPPVTPYHDVDYIPYQTTQSPIDYTQWDTQGYRTGHTFRVAEERAKKNSKAALDEGRIQMLLSNVNPVLAQAITASLENIKSSRNQDTYIPSTESSWLDTEMSKTPENNSISTSYDTSWLNTTSTPTTSNKAPSTTTNSKNNNPGNIRNADGSFKSFSSPQEGSKALVNQLVRYQTGNNKVGVKPNMTLEQAMGIYAPASDNNNPKQYAKFIADRLGITPQTQIKNVDVNEWASAISVMEGNTPFVEDDETVSLGMENGGELSSEKAKIMLEEGKANGKSLTDKQRKYFGWVAGGKKQNGGWLNNTGYLSGSSTEKNPVNVIPSSLITMKGVNYPVIGTDNTGVTQIMRPGEDYQFNGNFVVEKQFKWLNQFH